MWVYIGVREAHQEARSEFIRSAPLDILNRKESKNNNQGGGAKFTIAPPLKPEDTENITEPITGER